MGPDARLPEAIKDDRKQHNFLISAANWYLVVTSSCSLINGHGPLLPGPAPPPMPPGPNDLGAATGQQLSLEGVHVREQLVAKLLLDYRMHTVSQRFCARGLGLPGSDPDTGEGTVPGWIHPG